MWKCAQQLTGVAHKSTILLLSIVVIYLGVGFSTGVTERNAITAVMIGVTRVWNTCCRPRMLRAAGYCQQADELHQVLIVLAGVDQVCMREGRDGICVFLTLAKRNTEGSGRTERLHRGGHGRHEGHRRPQSARRTWSLAGERRAPSCGPCTRGG